MDLLTLECDETIFHRDLAVHKRDDLAFGLANAQSTAISSSAPIVEASVHKSTKMPGVPLNDGKEICFGPGKQSSVKS